MNKNREQIVSCAVQCISGDNCSGCWYRQYGEQCEAALGKDVRMLFNALGIEAEVLKDRIKEREEQIVGLSQELCKAQINGGAAEFRRGFDEAKKRFMAGFKAMEAFEKW